MNILIFAAHYWPRAGGVEHHVKGLAEGLAKKKQHVTIVTFRIRKWPHFENKNGVNIIRIPCIPLLGGLFPIPLPTITFIRQLRKISNTHWDVINTHTRFNLTTLLGTLYADMTRTWHIHTEHGNRHTPQPNLFVRAVAWFYDHTLGTLPFILADRVVVISKEGKRFAQHLGAKNKNIQYIPNSIDTKTFTRAPKGYRKKKKIAQDRYVITYVGRLTKAKGIADLIKATAQIPQSILIIVGTGPDQQRLQKLAQEEGVETRFLGRKKPSAIRTILSDSDVFVNPSYAEGLPTSVLEAGCIGLPIIATDVGGTNSILFKQSLYTPGDIPTLTKKLVRIQQHPVKAHKITIKTRHKIRTTFDAKNMIEEYYSLIKSLNST